MSKESTIHLFRRLEQLNGIGAALSRERDIDRLLENILEAAKTITGADGGTLYSVTDDQSALKFEILRTDSLSRHQPGRHHRQAHRPAAAAPAYGRRRAQ